MAVLSRSLIAAAYFLQASPRYQKSKTFFYNLLENSTYPYKKYFDAVMILLIFTSVAILIREVKFHVEDHLLFFNDYVISVVFLLEYMLRMWIHNSSSELIIAQFEHDEFLQRRFRWKKAVVAVIMKKVEYARSLAAMIDLLAIMPFFHELRLLRIFIIFRVFKLFRYANSLRHLLSVLTHKRFELLTLILFAAVVIFVSGVLIYIMEANDPDSPIDTLFESFYWALVTISTVGYGDLAPVSAEGRAVAMVIIISGIAVLSFSTSIVVSAFTERMDEIVENKTISDVNALKRFYLICGYGEVAQSVASKLKRQGQNVVLLDNNEAHVKEAKNHQLMALHLDPGSLESYKLLEIDFKTQVKAVLCLSDDDVANVYTALTVRSISGDILLLSVLIHQNNRKKLQLAGVDEIVYSQELIGMVAKEFSGKPVAFEAIHALRSEQSDVMNDEIVIDTYMQGRYKTLEHLGMARHRIILLGIHSLREKRFMFNPPKETPLEAGDILVVMASRTMIKEFKKILHTKVWK